MSDYTESIAALGQCRRCGAITRQAQPYCYQCALMQLDEEHAALAAAREEGRREGEVYAIDLAQRDAYERGRSAERNAHAAQLVALREEACGALCGECADGQPIVGTVNGIPMHPYRCGVGGCNRHGGNAQACAAQAIRALPLPDAEAALAKVREGAVRPWRRYAAHLPECATRDPRPADAPENQCSCGFVALDALGGKP